MNLESILADVRYSIRRLLSKPAITVVAVIVIAVGTGANTAMFTVINGILLRPLPFPNGDQLTSISVSGTQSNRSKLYVSYPDFEDWRGSSRYHREMGAWYTRDFSVTGIGDPFRVNTAFVTPSLFAVLGVGPSLGRLFEAGAGKDQDSVILSHGAWERWLGADRQVLGRNLSINGSTYTVIGVMPPTFEFPIQANAVEIWMKMNVEQGGLLANRGTRLLQVVGRMNPDVMLGQAQAEMSTIAGALRQEHPKTNFTIDVRVIPLTEELSGNMRSSLLALFGAVGMVLLISCVTVANLLVAEGSTRSQEIAVRTALGAPRTRIVRQLLTESMLLAIVGGIAGGLIGVWACKTLVALSTIDLPRINEIQLDGRVMAFTLGLTVLTGFLFGLAPAMHISAASPMNALKERTSGSGRSGSSRLTQNILIVTQVAVTQVLLVGAVVLIHSFWRLQQVNTGIDASNVLSLRLALPDSYEPKSVRDFYQRFSQRLETIPGARTASAVSPLPLSGENITVDIDIEGRPKLESAQPSADLRVIQPNYFRTMGIRLAGGRDFDERDNAEAPNVAAINEALARRYFDGRDPVGSRIVMGPMTYTLVGLVSDVRHLGPQHEARPEIYLSHAQAPLGEMFVVLKTETDPLIMIRSVRSALKELDANLPLYDVKTLQQRFASTSMRERFSMSLITAFAGVAFLLTALGLHGVVANSVAQRKREIAIRMALGASPAKILRRVVGQGGILVVIGMTIGISCAVILTQLLRSQFFGLSAVGPLLLVVLSVVFTSIALIACYIPARRASQIDPMVILRAE